MDDKIATIRYFSSDNWVTDYHGSTFKLNGFCSALHTSLCPQFCLSGSPALAQQTVSTEVHQYHCIRFPQNRMRVKQNTIIKEKHNFGIPYVVYNVKDNSCRLYWHGALFLVKLRPVVTSVDEVQVLGLDMLGKVLDVQTTGRCSCLVVLKHRQHSLIWN